MKKRLLIDLVIIFIGILVSVYLAEKSYVHTFIEYFSEHKILASFISGLFFTSAFTVSISIVFLGSLSLETPIFVVAFFGALGAVIVDLILFLFVSERLVFDLTPVSNLRLFAHLKEIFKKDFFRRISPVLGALIIASPLPDELGLALMGISHAKLRFVLPVTFVMNFIGIIFIALMARGIWG